MEKLDRNNGITLIALVITIIVLLIIAGITINIGTDTTSITQENRLFTELRMVQHAVQEVYYNYTVTKNKDTLKYTIVYNDDIASLAGELEVEQIIKTFNESKPEEYYYKLAPDKLREIGITNTRDTYIVNYKTGEVINESKKKINDKPLYLIGTNGNTIDFTGDH